MHSHLILAAAAAAVATFVTQAAFAQAGAPAREQVPGGTLMLAAYIVIWAVPLFLVWRSHRRLSDLEERTRGVALLLARSASWAAEPASEEAAREEAAE